MINYMLTCSEYERDCAFENNITLRNYQEYIYTQLIKKKFGANSYKKIYKLLSKFHSGLDNEFNTIINDFQNL